jgi:ABC-type glutathione transport system ATPase component
MNNTVLLRAENISKTFGRSGRSSPVRALDDVSFELHRATVLGIVGESGSGKSTLARILCRLLSPDSGTITVDGNTVDHYSRTDFSRKIQMIFQDPFSSLNPKLSIGTQLKEAAGKQSVEAITHILTTVDLPATILESYPHQFSGGQRQRIAIARALLKHPSLIIADEPLSALDVTTQNQIIQIFLALKNEHNTSFIFISHDLAVTRAIADSIMIMKSGRIVEHGSTESIINAPQTAYTQQLLAAVPVMV